MDGAEVTGRTCREHADEGTRSPWDIEGATPLPSKGRGDHGVRLMLPVEGGETYAGVTRSSRLPGPSTPRRADHAAWAGTRRPDAVTTHETSSVHVLTGRSVFDF